jgi:acetyl-CoA carboxylase carboxyltransferase component
MTAQIGPSYHWITVETGGQRFLRPVAAPLGLEALRVWTEAGVSADGFDRIRASGLVTATGLINGKLVALAWSDFRVNAGSYGQANSRRFVAFLRELDRRGAGPVPLLYFVNSAGISLMEGRRAFSDAFAIWPALLDHSSRHPLLTCATGKCLGLAPLLFGLGAYRMAVAGQTQLNLTGPEVIAMFFGEQVNFGECAGAERFVAKNDLIHELVPSIEVACLRMKALLSPGSMVERARPDGAATSLIGPFLDAPPQEVIPGWCDRLRLFLGTRNGRPLGIFINPPDRSNNLITIRTLEKYAAGLDLFRALGHPIVSFLDSPGVDPRFEQSDANNFRRMLWVGEKIIRYPHGSMGVVTRRCFGGATTLVFPKVFSGMRVVALRGSDLGAMHRSIVSRLLAGSPRLLEQWETVAAQQGPGLEDLLENGSLDAVIDPAELPGEIDGFLARLDERSAARVLTLRRAG